MSPLTPARFEALLRWALEGLARERSVFGLPKRSFWSGVGRCDLSIAAPAGRVATPLGVAAGPHTQLAQNLVVGWLAGARVLELKTVQVLDRLEIPRPCIDAPAEGYNVEWSQELRIEESLEQYVAAWCLVHALAPRTLGDGAAAALAGTRFDASVGYDLAGIRSQGVARFLDGLTDASATISRLREGLPPPLRAAWPASVPERVIDTVTLSSFHGCPAGEIEQIVEHLFARHGVNVVVKLNPTLLGFDEVDALLHGSLGWGHVTLERAAFERDLQWDHALELLERLRGVARRHRRELGVKLTNTLVVRNTRGRLAGDVAYLSGPPLHPIAIRLADRLARATGHAIRMSLSAGVCAENFAEAVACGFTPVTTCTDLLRPTGYRRLPRYLKALEAEMERTGTRTVDDYVRARAAERGEPQAGATAAARPDAPAALEIAPRAGVSAAARANLAAYAARVAEEPRYRAAANAVPETVRAPLGLVDCESCNQCTLVCPNGAFFDVTLGTGRVSTSDLAVAGGRVETIEAPIDAVCERQWVLWGEFCNACGNCDTFCPQSGGPHRTKAKLFGSLAAWEADAGDAVLVEAGGARFAVRVSGSVTRFERDAGGWRASDGVVEAELATDGRVREARALVVTRAHLTPLSRAFACVRLAEKALEGVNPLSGSRVLEITVHSKEVVP